MNNKIRKTFWALEDRWAEFRPLAQELGMSVSGAINNALQDFIDKHKDRK